VATYQQTWKNWKLDPEEHSKEKKKTTTEELFEKQWRIIQIFRDLQKQHI